MVISIISKPASSNALAADTASSAFSINTTGTNPALPILSSGFIKISNHVAFVERKKKVAQICKTSSHLLSDYLFLVINLAKEKTTF
jgi:hypothetical protein